MSYLSVYHLSYIYVHMHVCVSVCMYTHLHTCLHLVSMGICEAVLTVVPADAVLTANREEGWEREREGTSVCGWA